MERHFFHINQLVKTSHPVSKLSPSFYPALRLLILVLGDAVCLLYVPCCMFIRKKLSRYSRRLRNISISVANEHAISLTGNNFMESYDMPFIGIL